MTDKRPRIMRPHTVPTFEAARYPRTYQLARGVRQLMVPVGVLAFIFGLGGAVYFGLLTGAMPQARAIEGTLSLLFALLGLYVALSARMYRVVLEADRINVFGALRHQQLDRASIAGRRHSAGSARWLLVPTTGCGRKLELSMFLKTDKDFSAWILSLPDLDRDRKVAEEREASDAVSALKERGYSQVTLRKVAIWLNRSVYGLGLAIYFLPDPHNVLLWAALAWPWLAVATVAKFRPFYRFGGPSKSPLPDLSLSLFLPGCFSARGVDIDVDRWLAPLSCSHGSWWAYPYWSRNMCRSMAQKAPRRRDTPGIALLRIRLWGRT